jgi:Leucine-rich repeat (LRR) protein
MKKRVSKGSKGKLMKCFFFILAFLIVSTATFAQDMDAGQINQKMTEIRRNTDWDNPAEAKKGNEAIQQLSKQLKLLKQMGSAVKESNLEEIINENIEYNDQIWQQIMKTFREGEGADILLGEPVRVEIIEEYKDDESPIVKSQEYLDEMTLLVIDMSLKTVQRTIDQMDKFKSIRTLVITGGSSGSSVDLKDLLTRAENYPLEQLHIINFSLYVTEIPEQVGSFKNLSLLSFIGNNISDLPQEVGSLITLKILYVDNNPVTTLLPAISKLRQLESLGIGKTNITQAEIENLKQQLPNCKILLQ